MSQPNDFGALASAITGAVTEPKPWWQSRRQWGLLIWLVGWLLGRFGVEVDTATLTAFVPQMIEIIGAVIGVWGAIRAERPIDVARVLPGVSIPGVRSERVQADRADPFGSFGGSD